MKTTFTPTTTTTTNYIDACSYYLILNLKLLSNLRG